MFLGIFLLTLAIFWTERRLVISDPITTKYIINHPLFVFGPGHEKAVNVSFGYGSIVLVSADRHRYLRNNIMNPSFSAKNVRAALPTIREIGRKLADRWEALGFPGNTVDISGTLSDAALDVMGDVILEHSFNALGGESEVGRLQRTLLNMVSSPTKFAQLIDAALSYVPDLIFRVLYYLPIQALHILREYKKITDDLSAQLAARARDEGPSDTPDFVGAFVRDDTVPDGEIGVHLRTVLTAGEDTTGTTLGWILYKLAQMPDLQQELRREIQLAAQKEMPDYDNMALLNAIINASAALLFPGELLNKHIYSGGFALAFLGGPGVCLGWRLAISELQVFVVELVGRFVLSLPENDSVRARVAMTLVAESADGKRGIPLHVEHVT
ncbi:cytochrome P450 [Mycena maculata]|uniref:Cytochrome P450 n=1 Tax=Mycena maculata TaxID=230809 RepID=A0AAD7N4P9_9AGAR|nr:cytochrome P450 [Mycena maculata]